MMLRSVGDAVLPGAYTLQAAYRRALHYRRGEDWVFLVADELGRGPLNITFSGPRLFSVPEITLTPESLQADHRVYSLARAVRYDSRLALPLPVPPGRWRARLRRFRTEVLAHAHPLSLACLLDPDRAAAFQSTFEQALLRRVQTGAMALERGQWTPAAGAFKGCGRGSTPAGDDLLAGLLLGWHVAVALGRADLLPAIARIYRAALGANPLSNAYLTQAHAGRFPQHLKQAVESILYGPARALPRRAEKVLSAGATSGADLATGLILGLKLLA